MLAQTIGSGNGRRALRALVCAGAVLGLCYSTLATAQGWRGGQLAPEKRAAAWEAQAACVAKHLGVTEEAAAKIRDAYVTARKNHGEEVVKAMAEGQGGGRERFQALQDKADAEQATLKTALEGVLDAEQLNKAMAVLGSFSYQWDVMTDTLTSMGLEADKQQACMAQTAVYVAKLDAVRAKAREANDMEAARTGMQEARAELDKAMADQLTAEQLATWNEATRVRGREGAGRPGGGDGPPRNRAGER